MNLLLAVLGIVIAVFLLLLVPRVRKALSELSAWMVSTFSLSDETSQRWGMTVLLLVFFVIGVVLTAIAWGGIGARGMLWTLALAVGGYLIGFLFAIPKSVQSAEASKSGFTANTNLEQISDWLTKIIVGVSLVEFKTIAEQVEPLAMRIVKDAPGVPESVGLAMIGYFVPFGFLAGYLTTSVFFTVLLARSAQYLQSNLWQLQNQTPKDNGLDAPLTGEAARQANAIKNLSVDEAVKKQVPLDALSIAQLGTGNAQAALETASAALQSQAWNPRLHYLKAMALKKLGRQSEAVDALRDARRALAPDTEVELRKTILNSLTFNLLYLPNAYNECITVADDYIKQDADGADGAVWVNLACAFGQMAVKEPDTLPKAKAGALGAVKEALRVRADWRGRLRALYAPSAAMKAAGEDDLEVFRGDEEFEKLLG